MHNVSSLDLDGQSDVCAVNGFTNIDIRCKAETTVEFYKQCPSTRPQDQKKTIVTSSASYQCLGRWCDLYKLNCNWMIISVLVSSFISFPTL